MALARLTAARITPNKTQQGDWECVAHCCRDFVGECGPIGGERQRDFAGISTRSVLDGTSSQGRVNETGGGFEFTLNLA